MGAKRAREKSGEAKTRERGEWGRRGGRGRKRSEGEGKKV